MELKKTKIIAIFLFILAVLVSGCSASNPKESKALIEKDKPEGSSSKAQDLDQKVLSFNLEGYTEQGQKKWEIAGESADVVLDEVNLKKIVAKVYNEETTLTLTADAGSYQKNSGDILLTKNIVATTTDGSRLTAESLKWSQKQEQITTQDALTLEKDDIKISGDNAIASTKLKQVELKENAKVEMKPSTVITCEGSLEFDYELGVAVFNDKVVITDERGEISADKITAYIDKDNKNVREIVAEGNVRIKRGENNTYSEKAVYNAVDGKITLVGAPKLVIYPEEGNIPDMFPK